MHIDICNLDRKRYAHEAIQLGHARLVRVAQATAICAHLRVTLFPSARPSPAMSEPRPSRGFLGAALPGRGILRTADGDRNAEPSKANKSCQCGSLPPTDLPMANVLTKGLQPL
jgi:hypothetical protein